MYFASTYSPCKHNIIKWKIEYSAEKADNSLMFAVNGDGMM